MRYVRSKWRNWTIIHSHKRLAHYQPITMIYSRSSLVRMLGKHKRVFVKPDNSFGGKNVIRITRMGRYYIALGDRVRKFYGLNSLHRYIERIRKRKRWVIQQAVPLVRWRGRPVDIRTIAQKTRQNHWEVTGIFAKAAKKGAAVTNVKAGGSVVRVDRYLKWVGFDANQRKELVKKYKKVTIQISRALAKHFPNRLYALDLGMDSKRKVWLIEVNTKPRFDILKQIDMRMYRRTINVRRGKCK